jgi:hypothetical protein
MSEAAVISIYIGERRGSYCEQFPMNNVKVILDTGSDQWTIRLSRVPNIGERIQYSNRVYIVQSVTHTPNADDIAAEILASLAR